MILSPMPLPPKPLFVGRLIGGHTSSVLYPKAHRPKFRSNMMERPNLVVEHLSIAMDPTVMGTNFP